MVNDHFDNIKTIQLFDVFDACSRLFSVSVMKVCGGKKNGNKQYFFLNWSLSYVNNVFFTNISHLKIS